MLFKTTTTLAPTTASSSAAPNAHPLATNVTSTTVLVASAAAASGNRRHNIAVYAMVGLLVCGMGLLMVNLTLGDIDHWMGRWEESRVVALKLT